MKVTVCQLDNRAPGLKALLSELAEHIAGEGSEFLLLPEMCFAEWLAADAVPDRKRWLAAVKSHSEHILELGKLGAPAVIGTRPTVNDSGSFRNQAYLWTPPGSKADCGGLGWIISPEGDVLAQTSEQSPFASVELDLEFSRQSKSSYPRYVAE